MLPADWASLLEQIKPFGETDVPAVLAGAGSLLGFRSAQIEKSGRNLARIGGLRDFSDGHNIELPFSGSLLSLLWDGPANAEQVSSVASIAHLLDIALLAEDRRTAESPTPMMAPSGAKDRLTKTIDRDAFVDYLDIEFGAGPSNATVMVLGLDSMSVVNDTMSHTVGDIVIAETADRLRSTLRSCDIVSRLGGDVFGIYCPNMAIETATALCGRLQSAIARPISVQSKDLRVSASVGVAARAKGEKAAETVANGDTALQAAKERGAGEMVVYDGAIRMRTEDRRQLAIELVGALEDNQLTTALEPIVHLPDGVIVGVEAHVVWNHPTRGEVDRSEFMDLAELIGRVGDVERAVLDFALADPGSPSMRTGINVSASTLNDPVAIDWIAERLSSASDSKIIVEVTESAVSANSLAVRHLQRLRDAGASIVLDDFGLSFASLRTLHAFRFDGVKLHTSLLNDNEGSRVAIARAIYASASTAGFDVVHCCVDSDDDLRLLMSLDQQISGNGLYAQGSAIRARVEAATK